MRFQPSTIREGRNIKAEARKERVELRGRNSADFKKIVQPTLEKTIELSVQANRAWLKKEWQKISGDSEDAGNISFAEVVATFQTTLEKRIKMIARLEGISPEKIIKENERFSLIFDQAVFDFIIFIRKSRRRGDPLLQTLFLAELSHWLNPGDIARLNEKYKDKVDPSVIGRAALSYPKDPDKFIDSYLLEVVRLSKKYKDKVDPSVIKSAALSYPKDPDKFIDWFIKMKHYLLSTQPDRKLYLVTETLLSNHFKSEDELDKII